MATTTSDFANTLKSPEFHKAMSDSIADAMKTVLESIGLIDHAKKIKKELEELNKKNEDIRKQMSKGGKGDGGGGDSKIGFKSGFISAAILGVMKGASKELNIWNHLFKDLVLQEREYAMQMRHIGRNTRNLTSDTKKLNQEFSSMEKSAIQTGQNRTTLQKEYLSVLKKGIKSQKETLAITKTSLNLGTMMGSNAEEMHEIGLSTSDIFNRWNRELNLSNNQVSQISRGMQQVSTHTGITGKEMMAVVQESESLVQNMRSSMTLTADATSNVMEMMGQAKKIGVDKQMEAIISAATNTVSLFMKSSDEIQNLMFAAAGSMGRIGDLRTGELTKTASGMKSLSQGIENVINRFGVSLDDLDKLDPERLARLNLQLQTAFGMQLGDIQRIREALKESGKTYADRMAEVTAQLQNQNLTVEERLKLEKQGAKMQLDRGLQFMTAIDEAAKGARNLDQAVGDATKKLGPELLRDLGKMGIGDLKGVATMISQRIKEAGGSDLTDDLKKALDSGKISEVRELLAKMNVEYQKIGVQQQAAMDPLMQVAQYAKEINDSLRTFLSPISVAITNLVVLLGVGIATMSSIWGSVAGFGSILKMGFDYLTNFLSSPSSGTDAITKSIEKATKDQCECLTEACVSKNAPAATTQAEKSAGVAVAEEKDMGGSVPTAPSMISMGTKMAKWAVGLAALTIGLVALMAVVIKVSQEILGKAGITPAVATEVGVVILAMIGIAAAITAAAYSMMTIINEMENSLKDIKISSIVGASAKILMLVTPILLLAAAVMAISNAIVKTTGIGIGDATKLALDVASLITASAAIIGACYAASIGLSKVTENKEELDKLRQNIWTGASLLLKMGIPIITLSAAFLWFTKKILGVFGMDMGTTIKVSTDVGFLLGATALMITGLNLAMNAFSSLGKKGTFSNLLDTIPWMIVGGIMFAILAPAIVTLLASVAWFIGKIMSVLGMDAAEVARIADSVGDLIWASGKIMAACAVALLTLAGLGLLAIKGAAFFWPLIGFATIGGIVFTALAPAIVILAAGVMKIIDGVLKSVGINADVAAKIATDVASLIWASGKIAMVILAAAGALALLGKAAPFIMSQISSITIGGLAYFALAPAITLLFAGTMGLINGILKETGMDADKASKVAEDVYGLIVAATKIGIEIGAAATALSLLGKATPLISMLIPNMLKGANVYFLLTSAVTLLLAGTMAMVNAILRVTGIDAASAAKVAEDVYSLLIASGKILFELMTAGSVLMGMAGLLLMAPLLAGAMVLGAGALAIMGGAALILTGSLIQFVRSITDEVNPAEATITANAVSDLLNSASTIMSKLMLAGATFSMYASSFLVANLYAFAMEKGASSLRIMGGSALKLTIALLEFVGDISTGIDPAQAAMTAERVSDLMKSASSIISSFSQMRDMLLDMVGWSLISGIVSAMMETSADAFFQMAKPMGRFTKGVIILSQYMTGGLSGDQGREIADSVNAVSSIIKALGTSLDVLSDVIVPFMKRPWWTLWLKNSPAEQLAYYMPYFAKDFAAIADFVEKGLLEPIRNNFTGLGDLGELSDSVRFVSDIVSAVAVLMDVLSNKLTVFVSGGWWKNWLGIRTQIQVIRDNTEVFGKSFKAIAEFIRFGIIKPIQTSFPSSGELSRVADIVWGLSNVIAGVAEMLVGLNKNLLELVKPRLVGKSTFQKMKQMIPQFHIGFLVIARFLRIGIVEPINNEFPTLSPLIDAAKKLVALSLIVEKLPKLLDNLFYFLKPLVKIGEKGMSRMDELTSMTIPFKRGFTKIAEFLVEAVINPLTSDKFPSTDILLESVKRLTMVNVIMSSVAELMSTLENSIKPMADIDPFSGNSRLNQLVMMRRSFARGFASLAKFINEGIVESIKNEFPASNLVLEIAKRVKGMAMILGNLVPIIGSLSRVFDYFLNPSYFGIFGDSRMKKLTDRTGEFKTGFEQISAFLSTGVIFPVLNNFPASILVVELVKRLVGMIWILDLLPQVFSSLSSTMDALLNRSGFLWRKSSLKARFEAAQENMTSGFKAISDYLNSVTTAIGTFQSTNDFTITAEKLKNMTSLLDSVTSIFGKLELSLSSLSSQGDGFWNSILGFFGGGSSVLDQIKERIGKLDFSIFSECLKGIVDKVSDANFGKLEDIKPAAEKLNLLAGIMKSVSTLINALNVLTSEWATVSIWDSMKVWNPIKKTKIALLKDNLVNFISDFVGDGETGGIMGILNSRVLKKLGDITIDKDSVEKLATFATVVGSMSSMMTALESLSQFTKKPKYSMGKGTAGAYIGALMGVVGGPKGVIEGANKGAQLGNPETASSKIEDLAASISVLGPAFENILNILKTKIIEKLFKDTDIKGMLDDTIPKLEGLADFISILSGTFNTLTIQLLNGPLSQNTGGGFFTRIKEWADGFDTAAALRDNISKIQNGVKNMAATIAVICNNLLESMVPALAQYNEGSFNSMVKSLEGLGETLKQTDKTLTTLKPSIDKWTYDPWFSPSDIDKLKNNFEVFSNALGIILDSYKEISSKMTGRMFETGFGGRMIIAFVEIEKIFKSIDKIKDLDTAKIKSLTDIVNKVGTTLTPFASALASMITPFGAIGMASAGVTGYAEKFDGFIKSIDSIQEAAKKLKPENYKELLKLPENLKSILPSSGAIKTTITEIKAITSGLGDLATVLIALTESLKKLDKTSQNTNLKSILSTPLQKLEKNFPTAQTLPTGPDLVTPMEKQNKTNAAWIAQESQKGQAIMDAGTKAGEPILHSNETRHDPRRTFIATEGPYKGKEDYDIMYRTSQDLVRLMKEREDGKYKWADYNSEKNLSETRRGQAFTGKMDGGWISNDIYNKLKPSIPSPRESVSVQPKMDNVTDQFYQKQQTVQLKAEEKTQGKEELDELNDTNSKQLATLRMIKDGIGALLVAWQPSDTVGAANIPRPHASTATQNPAMTVDFPNWPVVQNTVASIGADPNLIA